MDSYQMIIKERFDMSDIETVKTMMSLNEQEKDQALANMANKIYVSIVNKSTEIDFGQIPNSKGDISKVPNIVELKECVNTIHDMLVKFNQPTDCTDTVLDAMNNLKDNKKTFERAFAIKNSLGMLTYNAITLSIISATSLLISTSIEFIKDPSDKTYKAFFDKVALKKTKDSMLFNDLELFNKNCKDIIKTLDECNSATIVHKEQYEDLPFAYNEAISIPAIVSAASSAVSIAIAGMSFIGKVGVVIGIITLILPLIHSMTSLLYSARQRFADNIEIQAHLIDLNIENLQMDSAKSDAEKDKIIKKQKEIADKMRKLSNKFAVRYQKAEAVAKKEIKEVENYKFKSSEVVTQAPGSRIF